MKQQVKSPAKRPPAPITRLTFHGIQIKSLECFRAFAASVNDIEERCGVHEVEIALSDIFFCPWIDVEQCRSTPMERLLIGLVGRLDTGSRG